MEPAQFEILHEHYRDSCTVMQGQRAARDRYFYLVIAVVAVAWFDVVAPQDFAAIVGDALKTRLQLPIAPDLGYLRSILWFLLLGLTVRYCQTALSVERHYDYIHDIEALLSKHVHEAFGREGNGLPLEISTVSHLGRLSVRGGMSPLAAWSCRHLDASSDPQLAASVMAWLGVV